MRTTKKNSGVQFRGTALLSSLRARDPPLLAAGRMRRAGAHRGQAKLQPPKCRERSSTTSAPPRLRFARVAAAASDVLLVARKTVRAPADRVSVASASVSGVSSIRSATTTSCRREPARKFNRRHTSAGSTMRPALSTVMGEPMAVEVADEEPTHFHIGRRDVKSLRPRWLTPANYGRSTQLQTIPESGSPASADIGLFVQRVDAAPLVQERPSNVGR